MQSTILSETDVTIYLLPFQIINSNNFINERTETYLPLPKAMKRGSLRQNLGVGVVSYQFIFACIIS